MPSMTETLRIFEPYPGLFAYFDGRIENRRLHGPDENWLDDGAYSLGIASYALVDGTEAIVYDTHMSLAHAKAIRDHLESLGVEEITVVLSHWHTDHIAGNEVFADCEMIALQLTADALEANRDSLETDTPPIKPVVMPNLMFETRLDMTLGERRIELLHFDIHSADGCVLWLPDEQILLAGDTLEDSVTYVSEPEHIRTHIDELTRMQAMPIAKILPNHGAPDVIAAGGYEASLIAANKSYLTRLLDPAERARARSQPLSAFIAEGSQSGAIGYFAPYEPVHKRNIDAIEQAEGAMTRTEPA